MKINNFRGELTGISAEREALVVQVPGPGEYEMQLPTDSFNLKASELGTTLGSTNSRDVELEDATSCHTSSFATKVLRAMQTDLPAERVRHQFRASCPRQRVFFQNIIKCFIWIL